MKKISWILVFTILLSLFTPVMGISADDSARNIDPIIINDCSDEGNNTFGWYYSNYYDKSVVTDGASSENALALTAITERASAEAFTLKADTTNVADLSSVKAISYYVEMPYLENNGRITLYPNLNSDANRFLGDIYAISADGTGYIKNPTNLNGFKGTIVITIPEGDELCFAPTWGSSKGEYTWKQFIEAYGMRSIVFYCYKSSSILGQSIVFDSLTLHYNLNLLIDNNIYTETEPETRTLAYISASNVNVREGYSTEHAIIDRLSYESVEVHGIVDKGYEVWYKVNCDSGTGYILNNDSYVETIKLSNSDPLVYIINNGVTTIFDCDDSASGTVIVPKTCGKNPVKVIDVGAFANLENVTAVSLPSSITYIDSYAFSGYTNLESIYFCGTEQQWNSIIIGDNNELLETAELYLHKYTNGACEFCGNTLACNNNHEFDFGEYLVEPTCLKEGLLAKHCKLCGFYMEEVAPSLGHCYLMNVVEPTCKQQGYTVYTCEACDESYIADFVLPSAHSYVDGICTVCGKSYLEPIDGFEYIIVGEEVTVTRYVGNDTDVVVPNYIKGYPVVKIGDGTFCDCVNVSSITVSDNVEVIGDFAFTDCYSLEEVKIGSGVNEFIESGRVFYGCDNLNSLIVDEDNSKYYSNGNCIIERESKTLVAGCKGSVIPYDGSVTSIGDSAFYGCYGIETLYIPNTVNSIGDAAFQVCSNLEKVYYCGTEEQWESVTVGSGNYYLIAAGVKMHHLISEYFDSTCTDLAYTKYTCFKCGYSYIAEDTDSEIHNYSEWQYICEFVDLTPDDELETEDDIHSSRKERLCLDCGEQEIVYLDDRFTSKITPPTCQTQGYTTYTCFYCKEYEYIGNYTEIAEHNYGEWIIENPTCTDYGSMNRNCLDCGQVESVELPPTEHNFQSGLRCRHIRNDDILHWDDPDFEEITDYEDDYLEEYEFCITCGYEGNAVRIEGLAFSTDTVEPTCTEQGYTYDWCVYCSETFNCYNYVDPIGHSYSEYVTPSTCAEQGFTNYICDNCGYSYTGNYTEPVGHVFEEEYQCYHYFDEAISPEPDLDDDYIIQVEPRDCLKVYKHCTVCEYEEEEYRDIEWYTYTYTMPTCTASGIDVARCNHCGVILGEYEIPSLGHDFGEYIGTIDPCLGGTQTRKCRRCSYIEEIITPAMGHEYEATIIEPDCVNQGYTTYVCVVCGHSYNDNFVDCLGHDLTVLIDRAPTCLQDGLLSTQCMRCNMIFDEIQPSLGHCYISNVIAPTCTNKGYTECVCENCGDCYNENYVDEIEHSYTDEVIAPTFDNQGYTLHTCTACGYSYKDNYTNALDENTPQIIVTSTRATVGRKVNIAVELKNNPGIASATLKIEYDSSVMTLTAVEDAGTLGTAVHSDQYGSPYVLCWVNDTATENYSFNGTVVTLSFNIKEDAQLGVYPVKVSYNYENFDIYNVNIEKVMFNTVDGEIEITDVIIGDVNGDGIVNNLDRVAITRYLANWSGYTEENIDLVAADVNCDGNVNNLDRVILTRFLANWSEYPELPLVG